ncbi:MAG: cyclic nucleotide-binding domain-containing protein [Magnetococcales bacterium]|nr:cyclic nucleotide-binding domain-containing protein [Magnetococcales bacterium]
MSLLEISSRVLLSFLKRVEGFSSLSDEDLLSLVLPMVTVLEYEKGDIIINKGSVGDTIFILFAGKVRIEVEGKENSPGLELKRGDVVGEMALVSNDPRSANVVATSSVVMLILDVETFQTLMMQNWQVCRAFANLIGHRVLEQEKRHWKSGNISSE